MFFINLADICSIAMLSVPASADIAYAVEA